MPILLPHHHQERCRLNLMLRLHPQIVLHKNMLQILLLLNFRYRLQIFLCLLRLLQ